MTFKLTEEINAHGNALGRKEVDVITFVSALLDTGQTKAEFFRRSQGFELPLEEVPGDFRGPEMPSLALRILENHAENHGYLDAATIGLAATSVVINPKQWQDWGSPKDTLQHIKYLWHILVVYGKPRMDIGTGQV